MTYYTAGRVGSKYRQHRHFFVMHIGVKMYEMKTGRDGLTRFKYIGAVEGTVTLDRVIRPKKQKLAQQIAADRGGVYKRQLKHNMKVDPMEALVLAGEQT